MLLLLPDNEDDINLYPLFIDYDTNKCISGIDFWVYFVYIVWWILKIGKRKVLTESYLKEQVLPQQGELLGRVIKLVGGDNIIVKCTDGKVRTCRIRGKIKRRMWIRDHDLVLVAPWDFQSDKADIIWRYIAAHAERLEQDGYLNGI